MVWVKGQPSANPNGRPKGTPEHHTRILRKAFVLAAEAAGGGGPDGLFKYLTKQAKDHPVAFMNALGKCIPLEFDARGQTQLTIKIVKRFDDVSTVAVPKLLEHEANVHERVGNGSGADDPASE